MTLVKMTIAQMSTIMIPRCSEKMMLAMYLPMQRMVRILDRQREVENSYISSPTSDIGK